MKEFTSIFIIMLLISTITAQNNTKEDAKVKALIDHFTSSYSNLRITPMQISYEDNFRGIRSLKSLKSQSAFFKEAKKKIDAINSSLISPNFLLDFELISYETTLNLERIALENNFLLHKDTINNLGIIHQLDGKKWYSYFLRKWIDATISPELMFEFGQEQVDQVYEQILAIQQRLGLDSLAFYQHIDNDSLRFASPDDIPQAMATTKAEVLEGMAPYFRDYNIPDVAIEKGTSEFLKEAPGYYYPPSLTLYYNLTKEMEYPRNTGWLFIHEGIPGHHFQMFVEQKQPKSDVQLLFNFYCYREGWAAYCEEIGKEIGGYPTIYQELGKLEWDIIRSVRVVLDVGLNYYGWSDEKALSYWQQYIPNKEDVALREIARMKRWPCQVITYKYGSQKILEWKNAAQKKQGAAFDIKEFHHQVLCKGSLPISILEKLVLGSLE